MPNRERVRQVKEEILKKLSEGHIHTHEVKGWLLSSHAHAGEKDSASTPIRGRRGTTFFLLLGVGRTREGSHPAGGAW